MKLPKKNILVKLKNEYEVKIIKRIISFITKKSFRKFIYKELINNDNKGQIKNYFRRAFVFFLYPFYISLNNKFVFKPVKLFLPIIIEFMKMELELGI